MCLIIPHTHIYRFFCSLIEKLTPSSSYILIIGLVFVSFQTSNTNITNKRTKKKKMRLTCEARLCDELITPQFAVGIYLFSFNQKWKKKNGFASFAQIVLIWHFVDDKLRFTWCSKVYLRDTFRIQCFRSEWVYIF